MSSRFSPRWWNDQALAAGELTKAAIELLTGMRFDTIPQPGYEAVGAITPWTIRVRDEAPGFSTAGLLLEQGDEPEPQPEGTAVTNPSGWANYPTHARFLSPVGNTPPGATGPWNPDLSDEAPPLTPEQRLASIEARLTEVERLAHL